MEFRQNEINFEVTSFEVVIKTRQNAHTNMFE